MKGFKIVPIFLAGLYMFMATNLLIGCEGHPLNSTLGKWQDIGTVLQISTSEYTYTIITTSGNYEVMYGRDDKQILNHIIVGHHYKGKVLTEERFRGIQLTDIEEIK
jgi:hypothetical protein